MPELIVVYQDNQHVLGEGIYFGMPEKLYHALPALSNSGFKNLLTSPPDFYFNSHLNPNRDEDAEDEDSREWQKFGRAAHSRILEGKKTFDELYCIEFLAPEGCLDTVADFKRYCLENGIDTKGSSKWNKPDWIGHVQFHNANALIYEVEEQKYFRETGGKIQLTAKDMRRIAIAAAMIENHQEIRHCFTGGYPEVTVLWFEGGLWFKARFDYLKPRAIVDLKTFTNKRNKPIDMALYETMAALKYHIQACHYTKAGMKAIEFAQKKLVNVTSPHRHQPAPEFIESLAKSKGHEFYFVFTKKGGAPVARCKKFGAGMRFNDDGSVTADLAMIQCGQASIEQAIRNYKAYFALYGTDIWVDATPITAFEDSLFPVWATEI